MTGIRCSLTSILLAGWLSAPADLPAAASATAEPTATAADIAWRDELASLAAEASQEGEPELARFIGGWWIPASKPLDGRQRILMIPPRPIEPPPSAAEVRERFLRARRRRGEAIFQEAAAAAAAGDRCEAVRLAAIALREDPDLERAREACGWVRRAGRWVSPAAAARLERGQVFSEAFGWQSAGEAGRLETGERLVGGRWVPAEEVPLPRPTDDPWVWRSDHWRITTTADLAAAARLAEALEQTRLVWWQAFGGFGWSDDELRRRFAGTPSPPRRAGSGMQATLFARRGVYVRTLEKIEPQAARTLGLYWTPTHTAYFFEENREPTTVWHEATHQLFAESRRTTNLAGEQSGFWAIEAVACYMESLEPDDHGWWLGGLDQGRVPMAACRLLEDDFYLPLEQLDGLGRVAFQARPDLPMLYSQISGLADFFINGRRGAYRNAFIDYLVAIYSGKAKPGMLATLCGKTYDELDRDYRRHIAR